MRGSSSPVPSQAEKQVVIGDDTTKQVCPEHGPQYTGVGRLEVVENHTPIERRKEGLAICGLRRHMFNLVCLICISLFIGIGAASGAVAAITREKKSIVESSRETSVNTTTQQTTISVEPSSILSIIFSTTSAASSASTISATLSTRLSSTVQSLSAVSLTASTLSASTSAAYNCPSDINTTYNPPNTTLVFQKACDTDWRKGDAGINGGLVADIGNFLAYTIDECIDICVNLPAGGCTAICYWGNITLALSAGFEGNCWLKNQRAVQSWTPDWQQEGAYLVHE